MHSHSSSSSISPTLLVFHRRMQVPWLRTVPRLRNLSVITLVHKIFQTDLKSLPVHPVCSYFFNAQELLAISLHFPISTDRSKAILLFGSICFMFWSRLFVMFEPYVRFHSFSKFG